MLIRLIDDQLIECPDELGALALANPRYGDVADFTLEEVNLLLSVIVSSLFDGDNTLEQNIVHARKQLTMWGEPDAANLEKALAHIKHYNTNMAEKDIGYSDMDFLIDVYGISSKRGKSAEDIIDQPTREVGRVLELVDGTKPLPGELSLAVKP
ncbi:MAG: hypothetical protein RL748_4490 [Pseudomonadota bacterium]|jgi:hypothetical protein